MYLLRDKEVPALDCEAEVMVDLMELAESYVEWFRGDDKYIVRVADMRNWDRKSNAGVSVTTAEAREPLVALKSAFTAWSNK